MVVVGGLVTTLFNARLSTSDRRNCVLGFPAGHPGNPGMQAPEGDHLRTFFVGTNRPRSKRQPCSQTGGLRGPESLRQVIRDLGGRVFQPLTHDWPLDVAIARVERQLP